VQTAEVATAYFSLQAYNGGFFNVLQIGPGSSAYPLKLLRPAEIKPTASGQISLRLRDVDDTEDRVRLYESGMIEALDFRGIKATSYVDTYADAAAKLLLRGHDGAAYVDVAQVGPGALLTLLAKAEASDDIEFKSSSKGVILIDRTTGTKYRLYVDNGVLDIEAV